MVDAQQALPESLVAEINAAATEAFHHWVASVTEE